MVALAHTETSTWQGIRTQLFGQQRERDAEDGLLRVITQLQTALAQATGLTDGPLRAPASRAQALRTVQDGLNGLIAWHREQLSAAQAVGGWNGPSPDLARDVLAAVQGMRPLFEGAEAREGALDCRDVAQSVAQLRGPESDTFFNDALDGLVAMLEAVYVRIGIDAPTATTAITLRDLWDVMIDELRALRCEEIDFVEVSGDLVSPETVEVLEPVAPNEPIEMTEVIHMANVIDFARFRRLELVAC